MATKDAHLYGAPRPKKQKTGNEISSSTTLSFTSQLASLISSSASVPTQPTSSRTKPRQKEDIFATHNRGTKKRAAKDLEAEEDAAKYAAAHLDDAAWRRTKRKMEEKARLYAAMKRGDVEDADEKHMVDFDRKWAEREDRGADSDSSSEEDASDEGGEMVEYTDEFGRTRRGTQAEATREERRKRSAAADTADRFTARPEQPTHIIFGDTIQSSAFNPDEPIAAQMEELAAKRDREATPPDALHYDANKEVRSKGVGFFKFSEDEQERQRQMEFLEKERQDTERARAAKERDEKREARKREVEERRKLITEKKGKVQAERFLDSLGDELQGSKDVNPSS